VDGPSALLESSNGAWTWSDGWQETSWRRRHTMSSDRVGAHARLRFSGTGVVIMGDYDDKGGTAEVLLDGAPAGAINARSVPRTTEDSYWHVTGLKSGEHTVEIRLTGDGGKPSGPVAIAGAVVYGK
jgi:hypothetical protein